MLQNAVIGNFMLTTKPYTTGGANTVAVEPERRGMVTAHIDDIERELIDAHDQLNKLIQRLQPVISTMPEKVGGQDDKSPGEAFPMGNRLMELKRSAQSLRHGLQYLNTRVEI